MWVVWVLVVAAVLAGVVLVALGRGDGLSPQELDDVIVDMPPERALDASDVASLRLPMALRGYRMADVDDVLDRLAAELALRDARIRELEGKPSRHTRPDADELSDGADANAIEPNA